MRILVFIISVIVCRLSLFAQVPNGNFEDYQVAQNCDFFENWYSINNYSIYCLVSKEPALCEGSASIKSNIEGVAWDTNTGLPIISASSVRWGTKYKKFFPIDIKPSSFSFCFEFEKDPSSNLGFEVVVEGKNDSDTIRLLNVFYEVSTINPEAVSFEFDVEKIMTLDSMSIEFKFFNHGINDVENVNSFFVVDDVKLNNDYCDNGCFELYPNPSSGVITFYVDSEHFESWGYQYQLVVLNEIGQVVEEISANSNFEQIDLSSLPSGSYILNIFGGEEMAYSRNLVLIK